MWKQKIWQEVIERFEQQAPGAVTAHLALDQALPASGIDEVFQAHRQRQYPRELLFSSVVELMLLGDAGSDGDTIRMGDDDLPAVGADVVISDADAAAARTSAGGEGGRKLETLAMAYGRMSFDLVRDPAPEATMWLKPPAEDILTFRLHGRRCGTSSLAETTWWSFTRWTRPS